MLLLDVPTMITMVAFVALAMAAATVYVSWEQGNRELWPLAAAMATLAVALLLYLRRGLAPDFLTVVVPNTFLATSFSLMLLVLLRFLGRRESAPLLVVPVILMAIGSAVMLGWSKPRVAWTMAIAAVQLFLIAWTVLRPSVGHAGRGRYLVAASAGCAGIGLLMRAISVALGPPEYASVLARGAIQTAAISIGFVAIVLGTFGFLFMTKERADERNRLLASRDELTGTLNRRFLMQQAESLFSHARRHGEPLAVLMVDLDFFKRVNDTHGHLAGDEVLRAVAKVIRERVRAEDVVGRFGGEEFLVILPGVGGEGGLALAESLREAVARAATEVEGLRIPVTVSVGVAGGPVSEAESVSRLIDRADDALYRAKAAGRNRVAAG